MPGPLPYNANIPSAPNDPADDQPLMQSNFASINAWVGIDHLNFGNANAGYHNIIHFNDQGSTDPTALGLGQLYTKTISADQQLFYESGSGVKSQLTSAIGTSASSNGYTFLPGGIILQWGFKNGSHSGSKHTFDPGDSSTVTFPIPFPNNVFNITTNLNFNSNTVGTPSTASALIVAIDIFKTTTTGFTWQTAGSGGSYTVFYWLAIGN